MVKTLKFAVAVWVNCLVTEQGIRCNSVPVGIYAQGLKRTIACMDEEHPRTVSSINNRSHLRQVLHMEALYRKNKVSLVAGA